MRLPKDLMREVKKVAAATDRKLTGVIENALREHLGRRHEAFTTSRIELPEDGEGGLLPGVTLDDGRALRKVLDEGHSFE